MSIIKLPIQTQVIKEKICSKCRDKKSISEFYEQKYGFLGRTSDCKQCRRWKSRMWARKNPEKILEYRKKYNEKRDIPSYTKEWREKNKEYFIEYYSNNKDKQSQRNKKSRQENPERCKLYNIVYYAIRSGKIKRKFKCQICKTDQSKIRFYHRDSSKPFDITWLCSNCLKKQKSM